MSDHTYDAQPLPGARFLDRVHFAWAGLYYLSIGLSFSWAVLSPPGELRGWPLAAVLAGVAASVALFQGVYWRCISRIEAWPLRRGVAAAYFGGQLLILAGLLALSTSFFGVGFALMGQIFGALRPRHWALPLVPLLALLAGPLGWLDLTAGPDWLGLASLALLLGVWLFVALLLSLLFAQRFRLLGLVRELHEARSQLEAAAAQQQELAVLRERTRLAREMHDSLGHALVSVNVKLEAAQRLYRVDAARGDAELEATRAVVRAAMGELRRSIADLRAPLADQHDLRAALRCLAEEITARGALAVAVADGAAQAPPPAVAQALVLIAREALLNAERHAHASGATVQLAHGEAGWSLEVADDGIGVRPADLQAPGHYGVVGMRERAAALGGSLEVAPGRGGGTRVVATIPDRAAEGR